MKKVITLFFLILLISAKTTFADNNFNINLESRYEFSENGTSIISDNFEITNKLTEKYLPSFEYKIYNAEVENISVEYSNQIVLPIVTKTDVSTNIKINFDDKVLGKGKKRNFTIKYFISNLATKTGDVWELSIPKNESINGYEIFKTKVIVPESFGTEAYLTPSYFEKSETDGNIKYVFEKDNLLESRIVIGFGNYQVFNFILNANLINDKGVSEEQVIALPPDTSYQRLFYEEIDPEPLNVEVDNDGNWLAKYKVPPRTTQNVRISGNVQLFANPRKYLTPPIQDLYENIKSTNYWQSNENAVLNISKNLSTAKDAYEFVINNLSYDYSLQKKDRIGAKEVISKNSKSTCRDFTDLLIALLRAKGIPAREIIGYAYSDNPDIKPISFYQDILHSWVEYWDSEKKLWVSIDPTWGATSKSDYFSKFDLRHFAFTIHGSDDSNPNPPVYFNPAGLEKSVFINFGELKASNEKTLNANKSSNSLFLLNRKNKIIIKNANNFALYDKNIKYFYDNKLVYEDNVDIIPPYSEITKDLSFKYSFLGLSAPNVILVTINNKVFKFDGPKYTDLFSQLIIIFLLLILSSAFIIFKHKKSTYDT